MRAHHSMCLGMFIENPMSQLDLKYGKSLNRNISQS